MAASQRERKGGSGGKKTFLDAHAGNVATCPESGFIPYVIIRWE
jgi:hypothetical protein